MKIAAEFPALDCAQTSRKHTTRWWVHCSACPIRAIFLNSRPTQRTSDFFVQ